MFEAIQVNNAYKKFGNASPPLWKSKAEPSKTGKVVKVAVDHVTFSVHEAEIFGVWGPNGSGKSTLIRLIATLLLPDAGSITVFGHDVVSQSMEVQRLINRVSVEASFFKKLSHEEEPVCGGALVGEGGKETPPQGGGDPHPVGIGEEHHTAAHGRDVAWDATEGGNRTRPALQAAAAPAGQTDHLCALGIA